MNLDDLRNADFSSLDTAVTKWSEMKEKLRTLAQDVATDLKGKADKADWAGVNASVTRGFIGKTSTEFQEMAGQAKSIHAILRDTASELKGYQSSLNERLSQEKDLHVRDNGNGTFTITPRDDAPDDAESAAETLKADIERILKDATTSDSSAADVLNSMMALTDMGFSDVDYGDRDSAAQALADAERAAELAGQKPEDLSEEDFQDLNRLLGAHHDDLLFAERFATGLGPQKTLEFWAGINDPRLTHDLRDVRDDYGALQENLGRTLATATRSDSSAMWDWEYTMAGLGDEKVTVDGRPSNAYGFQVMSNLMRWGDFDDRFLDNYGHQLIETEKRLSNNGAMSDTAWFDPVLGVGNLNHTGTDTGRDPMIGFLKSLSHSPDASTDFLHDTFVGKDEDHHFEDGDGNKRELTVFDYLMEERDWPPEHDADLDESQEGHNAFGEALEAATTGHPYGTAPSVETFPHSREQADLYERLVESVSEKPERLLDHGVMSDSMGRISAEYMPDINRALNPDEANKDRLFPVTDAVADLGQRDVTRFLHTVGRDPDGYAAVNLGQHNYTASLMEYHFRNPDAYISDPNFSEADNLKETIGSIARGAGEIQGTIGAGRTYEIEENGAERDAAYNGALDAANDWASSLVGAGIGVATAPYSGPGALVAGEVTKTGVKEILDAITGGMQRDSSDEIIYRNGERWDNYQESTSMLVQQGAGAAGESAGNPSPHIVTHAGGEAEAGFGSAQDNVHNYIDGQGVPSD